MASGWLRGLGAGIANAGQAVSQGMMADAQARREAEREAQREASAEKRWNKEVSLRKTERQEDANRRETERKADFAQRDKEGAAQREQQKYAVDASNSRTDKQLALMERRALVDDVNAVNQAGMNAIGDIQKRYAAEAAKLEENVLDPTKLAEQKKILRERLGQEVEQVNVQISARKQEVANAYGELGSKYLETINFSNDAGGDTPGLFETPDTSTGKEDAGGGTDGKGKKIPTVSDPNQGFGAGFSAGKEDLMQNSDQGWQRIKGFKSGVGYPLGVVGGAVGGLFDYESPEQRRQKAMTITK